MLPVARCVVYLFSAVLFAGCGLDGDGPDLVELRHLRPCRVAEGDTLEIQGRGLPEGVAAEVTFVGALHQAGRAVQHDVRVVAAARPAAGNRLSIPVGKPLHGAFCGTGDQSVHTTFRGRVVAAFEPEATGSAWVSGTLGGVVIDVAGGPASRAVARRRLQAAQSAMTALGLELASPLGQEGLLVVKAEGRAAEAGLVQGDQVLELDGLLLGAVTDFLPAGDRSSSRLLVRRSGSPDPVALRIPTEGLNPTFALTKMLPATAAWLVALMLGLWLGPASQAAAWIGRAWHVRMQSPGREATGPATVERERPLRWLLATVVGPGTGLARPHVLLVLAGLAAGFAAMALGRSLVAPIWDPWVLTVSALVSAALAGLIAGGSTHRTAFQLRAGLLSGAKAVLHYLTLVGAVLAATALVGRSSIGSAVAEQEGWPHRWTVFHDPGLFLCFVLLWVTMIPQVSGSACLAGTESRDPPARPQSVLDWVTLSTTAALMTALYLGGWALPVAASRVTGTTVIFGVAIFQLKCWLLVLSVLAARRILSCVPVFELTGFWVTRVLPWSGAALLLTWVWQAFVSWGPLEPVQTWVRPILAVMAVVLVLLAVHWILLRREPRVGSLGLNPWL